MILCCGSVCDELLLQRGGWNELSHGPGHPLPEGATSCPRGRRQRIPRLLRAARVHWVVLEVLPGARGDVTEDPATPVIRAVDGDASDLRDCLLYTSPSPRDS